MPNSTAIVEDSLAVSYKVKHILQYDSVVMLPGIYPTRVKTYVYTKTWCKCL